MPETSPAECPLCAKHRGGGPLRSPEVWRDDLVVVTHLPPRDGPVCLGYLFVEPLRHAPHIEDLTDAEAATIGIAVRRAAVALRAELDLEHVFSAVIGLGVPHFHQHVFPRHRGTPAGTRWFESATWEGAPRGDLAQTEDLCTRLRPHFTT